MRHLGILCNVKAQSICHVLKFGIIKSIEELQQQNLTPFSTFLPKNSFEVSMVPLEDFPSSCHNLRENLHILKYYKMEISWLRINL